MIGVCLAAAWVGNALGLGLAPVDLPEAKSRGWGQVHEMPCRVDRLLAGYFTLYGPQLFFSAVLVGLFGGWVLAFKLLPHMLGPVFPAAWVARERPYRASARLRRRVAAAPKDVPLRREYLAARTDLDAAPDAGVVHRLAVLAGSVLVGGLLGSVMGAESTKASFRHLGPPRCAVLGAVAGPFAVVYAGGLDPKDPWWAVRGELGPLPPDRPAGPGRRPEAVPGRLTGRGSVLNS
jgi:hypothetical protein